MTFERNKTADDFETMLRRHLALSNRLNAPCAEFDAELANAYLEGALEGTSRTRYESHLSGCADCRHGIVALNRLAPAIAPALGLSGAPARRLEWWQSIKDGLRMPGWRYAAVGMASVIVAFGVFYVVKPPSPATAPQAEIAMSQSAPQAQPPEAQTATGQAVAPAATPRVDVRLDPHREQAGQLVRARLNTSGGILAGSTPTSSSIISGKVSSIGGLAVAEAEVALVDSVSQQTQAATRTDALGQFRLPALPEGTYRLTVQAEGYASQQISDVRPVIAQDLQVKLDLGPSGRQALASLQQRSVAVETEGKKETTNLETIAQREDTQKRPEAAAPARSSSTSGLADNNRPVPETGARRLAPREAAAKAAKAQATPARSNDDENFRPLLKKVRDKTFRFDRGVWIDQDYKPENRLPRTRLTRDSAEFEKAVSDNPSLAPFFDLGRVIVIWQGRVFEVRK